MSDVEELRRRVEAASERLLQNDQRRRASGDRLSTLVQDIEEQLNAKHTDFTRQESEIVRIRQENDQLVVLVTELLEIIERIDVPGLADFVDDLVSRLSDRVRDAVAAMPVLVDQEPSADAAVPEPQPEPQPEPDASDFDENGDKGTLETATALDEGGLETSPDASQSAPADRPEPPDGQAVDAKIALHSVVAEADPGNRPGSGPGAELSRKRPALRAVTGGRTSQSTPIPIDPSPPIVDQGGDLGNRDEQRQGEDRELSIDQAGLQSIEVDALIDGQVSIDQLKQRIDARRRRGGAKEDSDQGTPEHDIFGLAKLLPVDAPESPDEDTVAAVDDSAEPKSVRSVLEGIIDELEDIKPDKTDQGGAAKRRPDSGQKPVIDPTLTTKITTALKRISENDGN